MQRMKPNELTEILQFLREAEQLKDTLRTAYTSSGRQESTAEHSWRLCLLVMLFADQYPDIDALKLIKMCIVHDLGEAINGDVSALHLHEGTAEAVDERRDLKTLLTPLPERLHDEILMLWDDYEQARSKEAGLAKAFDKLDTILQHIQGKNPDDFNYTFNLSYGKKYTDLDPLTADLRQLLDIETQRLTDAASPQN